MHEDRTRALELYKAGARLSDSESRNHLGDAFRDKANNFYDPVTAYAWYSSVERYRNDPLPGYEEVEAQVIDHARASASALKSELTPDELSKVKEILNRLK